MIVQRHIQFNSDGGADRPGLVTRLVCVPERVEPVYRCDEGWWWSALNGLLKTMEHCARHGCVNRDRETERRNTLDQSQQHESISLLRTLTTAACMRPGESR
jgi:hypothetical protein